MFSSNNCEQDAVIISIINGWTAGRHCYLLYYWLPGKQSSLMPAAMSMCMEFYINLFQLIEAKLNNLSVLFFLTVIASHSVEHSFHPRHLSETNNLYTMFGSIVGAVVPLVYRT